METAQERQASIKGDSLMYVCVIAVLITYVMVAAMRVQGIGLPAPLAVLSHRFCVQEWSPRGDQIWTCRSCSIRFTSKEDPTDPHSRLVGLTSLKTKGFNTQWRKVPGQKTELHRLFAIDGVIAAEFTAGPTRQVMWDDLGTISLESVTPSTPQSRKMLSIFRWIE